MQSNSFYPFAILVIKLYRRCVARPWPFKHQTHRMVKYAAELATPLPITVAYTLKQCEGDTELTDLERKASVAIRIVIVS